MANQRRLNLQKFNISRARYDELRGFCLQYNEWKQRLKELRELSSAQYSNGGGKSGISNPTEKAAIKSIEYLNKIDLVEKALKIAVGNEKNIYDEMLKNITSGIKFEDLNIPMCRTDFYNSRTAFFVNLDKLL
ncbi:MAG: hypothetical protein RR355_00130 [Oscillospiraceae bacterium]